MKKIVQVAVGLVFNDQNEILLAWRDSNKIPGDCWEFPGGKMESGETAYQALCRELMEEVGIEITSAHSFPRITHQYETAEVILHPWRVETYLGVPRGVEGQIISWVPLSELRNFSLPAANYEIVDLLVA